MTEKNLTEIDETPTPRPTRHDETLIDKPTTWDETVVGAPAGPVEPPPPPRTPGPRPGSLPEPARAPALDRTAELKDYTVDTGPLPPAEASSRGGGMSWAIAGVILASLVCGVLVCGAAAFFLLGGTDLLTRTTATPALAAAVTPAPTRAPVTPTPTLKPIQTETVIVAETVTLPTPATSTPTVKPTQVTPSPSPTIPPTTPVVSPSATPRTSTVEPPTVTPTSTAAPTDTPTSTPTATPTPVVSTVEPSPPPVPAGMVRIPAGDFIQGSSDAEIDAAIQTCDNAFGGTCPHPRDWFTDETPRRTVYLDEFYIDKWEVTNQQFADFAAVTSYATDAEKKGEGQTWRTFNTPGREKFPVVWMSWNDANAYCQWAGKRLPTEAEWEKAARGTDGRIWPWGSNWETGRANTSDGGAGSVAAVGNYPASASPYGIMDMTGNVWEWVADWYDPLWYSNSPLRNPGGPPQGAGRVLRGGSFRNPPWEVRAVHRHSGGPDGYAPDHGFRCAK